jgi:hypothetical protein
MIYSPETNTTLFLYSHYYTQSWFTNAFFKMLTLCTLVLLHHARPVLHSSSFSIPLPCRSWLLNFSTPWGPGPPSPLSPELNPFPSGPRQRPAFMSGTLGMVVEKYSRGYWQFSGKFVGRLQSVLSTLWKLCESVSNPLTNFLVVLETFQKN